MKSTVPCGNVHTGPRQGQGPGPIVSYCPSPIFISGVGPVSVQRGKAMAPLDAVWTTEIHLTYIEYSNDVFKHNAPIATYQYFTVDGHSTLLR